MLEDTTVFDIETDRNNEAERFMPEFAADGRLTDPVKIKQSIRDKEDAWKEKCALDAVTGRILCIAYKHDNGPILVDALDDDDKMIDMDGVTWVDTESAILHRFWMRYSQRTGYMVGWNINEFDMLFIHQRSLINGIKPPGSPLDKNWNMLIDLMERWNHYNRKKMSSLNEVAKALNVGSKLDGGEISKNFGKFWRENRSLALQNAIEDIRLTYEVMKKIL